MTPLTRKPGGYRASNLSNQVYSNCTDKYTTNGIDCLLDRLEKVRETAPGQWLACCPAHHDKSPSLSIKRADDRLLLHCFAGCPASDVVAAVGLTLADLFDKPLTHHGKPLRPAQRRRYGQAAEALKALVHECRVVWCAAEQMQAGFNLDPDERERLSLAMRRVAHAQGVAG